MNLDLSTIDRCVNELMTRLETAKDELRRCEQSCGKGHDIRRMLKLQAEIESVERRLKRAERLQEAALTGR